MTVAEGGGDSCPPAIGRHAISLVRWNAYFRERFPLLLYGVLICSLVSSNQFLAHALTRPGGPMVYGVDTILGCATLFCFFLHLRVFDDLKDYAHDCQYYPDRILQRGIVTRRELATLGMAAMAAEVMFSAAVGPHVLINVLIAQGFSLLMYKEFFASSWLKRHFVIYACTHMLIMPLLSLVIFGFATRSFMWQAPGWFGLYSVVVYFVAFNLEISRKMRAPEEEIDGVDTYTAVFGTYGAAYIVLAARAIDTTLVGLIGYHLGVSPWFYLALIMLFAVCLIGLLQYRFRTNRTTARRLEMYASMYVFAFDVTLIVELGSSHGITWAA